MALVWSCLATIITCTWSALHLNVPARNDGLWTRSVRKVKWVCITILFPEFVFAKAICELKDAVDDTYEMKYHEGAFPWHVEFDGVCRALHRLFHVFDFITLHKLPSANINDGPTTDVEPVLPTLDGSPVILDPSPEQETNLADQVSESAKPTGKPFKRMSSNPRFERPHEDVYGLSRNRWTLVHSYLANMGGFLECLGSWQVRHVRTLDIIDRYQRFTGKSNMFPSKADIDDRGKADLLVKSLAVLQITWLVLSIIVRGITSLPVSQLEITTLAFAILAIATYISNLWKPKDVARPFILALGQDLQLALTDDLLQHHRSKHEDVEKYVETRSQARSFLKQMLWPSKVSSAKFEGHRVANDIFQVNGSVPMIAVATAMSTLAFGGLHCIAWSFEFPSKAESSTWRLASIVSSTLR